MSDALQEFLEEINALHLARYDAYARHASANTDAGEREYATYIRAIDRAYLRACKLFDAEEARIRAGCAASGIEYTGPSRLNLTESKYLKAPSVL